MSKELLNSSNDISSNYNNLEIFDNVRYVVQSCTLITESLKKGCDVLQMSNGDVIITEVKVYTYHYEWDEEKGKFARVKNDRRNKKSKYDSDEFDD